jgi:TRAP-type mannitol/chloroaromatic compound transport system substrate-binding protein
MYTDNFAGSVDAWAQMKTDFPNIEVKTFPKPVLQAMKKAADELYDEYAAKDPSFKEVLDSQRAYMKKARVWTNISEYNYIKTVGELEE